MPSGIATAEQLAMMARVLDAYCDFYRVNDDVTRENAAALILQLFDAGFREDDVLLAEMIERRR